MSTPVIQLHHVSFAWPRQPTLLDIASLTLQPGERVFLKGPSGSGKTTLLSLIGGVQLPDHGQIRLLGQDLARLSRSARDQFRADHSGYIFQMFNLLPYLSVIENIALPCHFSRLRRQRAAERYGSVAAAATALLEQLGLSQAVVGEQPVAELSIGQQQRVAAARALIGSPELIIADEPTSALDADTREAFLELLFAECQAAGSALLFVSHDGALEGMFDRSLALGDLNRAASLQEAS
ncbi:ABC transporter-like protein [Pseudomonas saudimassiliensis]|uniref:ABC transporter-like protein n=1 Tax=Pseudomonas saudimassiliensis TaxID=1461581 RepID=A0A078MK22_9PSED|nr:ABC transporter ATP-binding protein [Pseudomonas saudimassiliensis]CEA06594.1 ABC transporter-like protein [Pseudomonas saudimassiliensis]CEF27993.1 ABC transporter-like protein [Pseudomonas saudimassiliensis]